MLIIPVCNCRLQSREGLEAFQKGRLPDVDDAWHRLVPPAGLEAFGKKEVKRQSQIFEIIKTERNCKNQNSAVIIFV